MVVRSEQRNIKIIKEIEGGEVDEKKMLSKAIVTLTFRKVLEKRFFQEVVFFFHTKLWCSFLNNLIFQVRPCLYIVFEKIVEEFFVSFESVG